MKRGPVAPPLPEPPDPVLHEREFRRLRDILHAETGIELGAQKQALVVNRLLGRLRALGLPNFRRYTEFLTQSEGAEERQLAIDLLTTNETYFFREPAHFRLLLDRVRAEDSPGRRWRIWSAACSSGEEPFSIAMTLADALGEAGDGARFEVLGSDISRRMLARATRAHYPLERLEELPPAYLRRFCRKGTGPEEGTLLVDRSLREHVRFLPLNLMEPLPELGSFDAVFLRNALIYFNRPAREAIVRRVTATLAPGGHLFVSHSESLNGLAPGLTLVQPSLYRRSG